MNRWYIKVEANGIPEEVARWRGKPWRRPGFIDYEGRWCISPPNSTANKISLNSFKKQIMGKKEFPKEMLVWNGDNEKGALKATIYAYVDDEKCSHPWIGMSSRFQHAKEAPRYEMPEIREYSGEIIKRAGWGDGLIKYGCAVFPASLITNIVEHNQRTDLLKHGITRRINSIILDSGVQISYNQMKQIYEYITNKKD